MAVGCGRRGFITSTTGCFKMLEDKKYFFHNSLRGKGVQGLRCKGVAADSFVPKPTMKRI